MFHIEKTFNISLIKKENNLCQTKVIVEGPKTSPPFKSDQRNSQHPLFDIWGFKKNVFEMTHAIGQIPLG